ncbi:MAG: family 78 glycoside hydrolase catalytic domain [Lentisphaeria bacterium]|nr:family 78 glycoside hydrolase catalytic domain [Lentisphaeria bacterium]
MTEKEIVSNGAWIWARDAGTGPDTYAAFRREIFFDAVPPKAELDLAADSDFTLYVNGKVVPGTQFSDYPQRKTYTAFDLSSRLVAGKNVIAVLVHFIGEDFLRELKGFPGLWAVLHDGAKVIDASSPAWRGIRAPGFRSGDCVKFTLQLGFSTVFDAREPGACTWMETDFDDPAWPEAVDVTGKFQRTLKTRPLPVLIDCACRETTLVQHGFIRRTGIGGTPSQVMYSDYLRELLLRNAVSEDILALYVSGNIVVGNQKKFVLDPAGSFPFKFRTSDGDPDANGYYVIADLERETTGFITFDVDCAGGTVVDYALGEHLSSGRVRTSIAERNLSDRFICKEGRNVFQLRIRRCAGRYLELHFAEAARPPKVFFAGVAEQLYPLGKEAPFDCPDPLRMKTHAVAVDTLKNCMHEHYEDCPWREQSLYAYDSRNQALYGYYTWGNYRFAEASFDLLGQSRRPDGYLALTAPGAHQLAIPIFSLAWIAEVYEHCFFTGSTALFERNAPVVRQLLDFFLSRPTASGLYFPGRGERVWNFAEWVPGLSGNEVEEQAPFNIYLYEALLLADKLFRATGISAPDYAAVAEKLGKAVEKRFYLPEKGCYASFLEGDDAKFLHEHTQALMLFNGLVPEEKIPRLLETIRRGGELIPCTYSSMPFLIRALMRFGKDVQDYAASRVSRAFDSLTLLGATTLWENPADDSLGGDAASLCHGWSSLPVYFNKRYILGVRPLEPGFKTFSVTPYCGDLLRASGEVPTPRGPIRVSWERRDAGLRLDVEAPEGTQYVPGK